MMTSHKQRSPDRSNKLGAWKNTYPPQHLAAKPRKPSKEATMAKLISIIVATLLIFVSYANPASAQTEGDAAVVVGAAIPPDASAPTGFTMDERGVIILPDLPPVPQGRMAPPPVAGTVVRAIAPPPPPLVLSPPPPRVPQRPTMVVVAPPPPPVLVTAEEPAPVRSETAIDPATQRAVAIVFRDDREPRQQTVIQATVCIAPTLREARDGNGRAVCRFWRDGSATVALPLTREWAHPAVVAVARLQADPNPDWRSYREFCLGDGAGVTVTSADATGRQWAWRRNRECR